MAAEVDSDETEDDVVERQRYLQKVTRRLVAFTCVILVLMAIILYSYLGQSKHSYLVLIVFTAGLLGGFVSIQQRLPKISLAELKVLSSSWISITLIPVNGGVFALVLMLMFAGNIIQGQLFPTYPTGDKFPITDANTFIAWLTYSYPTTGIEVAKLLFWSFVAGFSERFVPQIIRQTTQRATAKGKD